MCFAEDSGQRTGFDVVTLDDPSELPAAAEPWFLALNADIGFHPAMIPDDLEKADPSIEAAVRKYG